MGRLHAIDVAFLELERSRPPLAVGTAAEVDGPAPEVDAVRAMVADRVPLMARLAEVLDHDRGGLRRPQWLPVPGGPDLAHHVRGVRAAGGDLDRVVSETMRRPLDHDRPLWDLTVVDGLPRDRWALVWRVHHCAADGFGAMMLLGHAFDLAPDGRGTLTSALVEAAAAAGPPSRGAPVTGPAAAAAAPGAAADRDAGGEFAAAARGLASWSGGVAGEALSRASRLAGVLPDLLRTARGTAPRPPGQLSGTLGDTRRWESRTAPLADAKAVGKVFGATVNDVVLAGVTAGFRAVLMSCGDVRADRHLRVMVPVSLRQPGNTASDNQVSAVTVPLPVGLADPVDRLTEVAATTRRLKDVGAPALGVALLGAVDALVPAAVQDVAVGYGHAVPEWFVEGVVTNVPGPQFPLWVMGRRVRTLTPTIPLGGNLRLIVGVLSFDGALDIGVTGDGADPAAVHMLADGIVDGIAELRERADR